MEGYKGVSTSDVENNAVKKVPWTPLLRQLLICSGVWISYFAYGMCIGSPTVFIPQIRRELNSTEAISEEMASWLASAIGFSGFPCVVILSILTRLIGRKIPFIVAVINAFVAFIVFFCSTTVVQILVSEIMQGLFSAAQVVISIIILTEYTSPKYRGVFLTIKATIFYWGIWAANALGTFVHWKQIGLLGMLCTVYTVTTIFIWPESPYWLASKGKYKECAASHRWLKGCDDESERELEIMISTQKEYIKSCRKVNLTAAATAKEWYTTVTSPDFYKPTIIASITGTLSLFTGKLVCTVYAIDIIKKITDSEATAYNGMLMLDGITITSMYVGCILSKYFKRRSLFLITSVIGALFLYLLSLYLYLIHLSVIIENKYVSVCLLIAFSIAISSGPLILSTSIYGELIPLRSRSLVTCILALEAKLFSAVLLKVSPSIFKTFGVHGTFFFFGLSSTSCILFLYKYLPETKDKTLQEITDSIRGTDSSKNTLLHKS